MEILEVGKPYVEGKTAWPEALEYNYDAAGHRLRIFLRMPSEDEINAIWHGEDSRFGLWAEDDLILLCFQFRHKGRLVFWGEAPYSWWFVAPEDRALPDLAALGPDMGWALSIILINAETGLIEGLRVMSFSHRFSVALAQAIHKQAALTWDESAYDAHWRQLQAGYDSKQLWRQCLVTCRAGETDSGPMPEGEDRPLFALGQIVGTPGALAALEEAGHSAAEFILRHNAGDFGELGQYANTTLTEDEAARGPLATAEDDKLNKWGIDTEQGRIFSAYILSSGVKIWIITE